MNKEDQKFLWISIVSFEVKVRVRSNEAYSVGLRKTVQDREDEFGVAVGVVGQEDAHRVHEHLVEAAREHGLRELPQVLLQKACEESDRQLELKHR